MDSVIKGQKFLASLITRTLQTMPLSFPRMQQAKWCAMHNVVSFLLRFGAIFLNQFEEKIENMSALIATGS